MSPQDWFQYIADHGMWRCLEQTGKMWKQPNMGTSLWKVFCPHMTPVGHWALFIADVLIHALATGAFHQIRHAGCAWLRVSLLCYCALCWKIGGRRHQGVSPFYLARGDEPRQGRVSPGELSFCEAESKSAPSRGTQKTQCFDVFFSALVAHDGST